MASEDARWLLRRAARRDEGHFWWWMLGGFVILLALWNGRGASPDAQGLAPSAPAEPWRTFAGVVTTVDDITGDPGTFIGMIVTVGGEINRVLGRRAFTVGGGSFGGAELLVVTAAPLPDVVDRPPGAPLAPGDLVLATGPVRRFDQVSFQRESHAVLNRGLLAGWAGRPAVLAQDVRISSRVAAPGPPAGQPTAPGGARPGVPPLAPGVAPPGTAAPGTTATGAPAGTDVPGAVPGTAAPAAKPPSTSGTRPTRTVPGAPSPAAGTSPAAPADAVTPPPAGDATGPGAEPPMGYLPEPAPAPPAVSPSGGAEPHAAPATGAPSRSVPQPSGGAAPQGRPAAPPSPAARRPSTPPGGAR